MKGRESGWSTDPAPNGASLTVKEARFLPTLSVRTVEHRLWARLLDLLPELHQVGVERLRAQELRLDVRPEADRRAVLHGHGGVGRHLLAVHERPEGRHGVAH